MRENKNTQKLNSFIWKNARRAAKKYWKMKLIVLRLLLKSFSVKLNSDIVPPVEGGRFLFNAINRQSELSSDQKIVQTQHMDEAINKK